MSHSESLPLTQPAHVCVGTVNGYRILIVGDRLQVWRDGTDRSWSRQIPNYGTSIGELMARPGAALGWAQMQGDGDEILYLYDRNDDGFGYAFNLNCDWCSEWGYSPFSCGEAT